MFGKKKQKQGSFNMMDDSRVVANDFIRRSQYESYRPVDYRVYHKLCEEEMIQRLDQHLDALLAGDVDDANGDMLDNIIFGPYREAIPDLRIQRLNHKDVNRRLAACRAADREDFVRLEADRQKELLHLEKEYEDTCNKINAVEEGKS